MSSLVPRAGGGPVIASKADSGKGGGVIVNVQNNGTDKIDVQQRQVDGRQVIDIVVNAVADNIARGGIVDKTLRGSYQGMSRLSVLRS